MLNISDATEYREGSEEEAKFYVNLKINFSLHQTKRIEHSFYMPGKPPK